MSATARLQTIYQKTAIPALIGKFGYKSPHQVPRLTKVTVNMGLGKAVEDIKIIDQGARDLGLITGQRPVVTKARISMATYKLRKGMSIGCMVTLRRKRMWEFVDKLVNVSLPRVKDFKGVSKKSFDGRGNYTLGLKEQLIFPEIEYDKVEKVIGMNVTITTTAKKDEEALELLTLLGMPFRSEK
jgi:large subunit ribosomal protein L5